METTHREGRSTMKIVVIGGTGLIGSNVAILRQRGHEVNAAPRRKAGSTPSPARAQSALSGAQVVIDLANSQSFEDQAVLLNSSRPRRNLHAEAAAGVRAPCRAVHRRDRLDRRQRLFPRQGRVKTDRRLRHPLHHRPRDPVPAPRRHRRSERGWKPGQAAAQPVPADRGGTTSPCSSPRRSWRRRATASSRSPAWNARRSTRSSPVT